MTIKHKLAYLDVIAAIVVLVILGVMGAKLIFSTHASGLLPGDANSDGVVNISDLAILAAHYGTASGATWSTGDFNSDGAVNIEDLSLLAAHWGDTQVVPAPTVSLSASPTSVTSGSSSTLTWSSTNATSCTASGSWSGSQATSGSTSTSALSTTSTYNLDCSGSGGSTSASAVVTVTAATCATTPPTVSDDSLYPLQQVVSFTGSTLPSQWQDYGNGIQQPAGYVAADHAVFVPGTGLEIKGYVDSISGSVGGVTGGSGDVNFNVANSGGFDVCFSMSSGSWQNVHLVLISWPTDNNWDEGENDFFEGNPQDMAINVHEIGSSPATNVWQGSWPAGLADGGVHDISARWDPINGYRFYLDGSLIGTAPVGGSIATPTTAHHLSMQMQDTTESSTSTETATIYWVAAYGYSD